MFSLVPAPAADRDFTVSLKVTQFGGPLQGKEMTNGDSKFRCQALEKAGVSEKPQHLSVMSFMIRPLSASYIIKAQYVYLEGIVV